MERVISDEEKIRKAIEIYQRRNNVYYLNPTRVNVGENRKNYRLFKKMLLQTLICLVIYAVFYILNTNNMFSENLVKKTKNVLNYDMNFEKIYKDCENIFNTKINTFLYKDKTEATSVNIINEVNEEEIQNLILDNSTTDKENNLDIKEEKEKSESKVEDVSKEKTGMELDVERAIEICKFKKPISGKVTSEFGDREVTSKVMSADHKGIDIAAKSGTNIKSAINGKVSVAEENSEYGKFIKITNGDVMTVYAHCQKIKVKVGEEVKMGQNIATVGSTGNSTGPHLHFEIRVSGRYINPRYVIEF